jgi:hypothetical protein
MFAVAYVGLATCGGCRRRSLVREVEVELSRWRRGQSLWVLMVASPSSRQAQTRCVKEACRRQRLVRRCSIHHQICMCGDRRITNSKSTCRNVDNWNVGERILGNERECSKQIGWRIYRRKLPHSERYLTARTGIFVSSVEDPGPIKPLQSFPISTLSQNQYEAGIFAHQPSTASLNHHTRGRGSGLHSPHQTSEDGERKFEWWFRPTYYPRCEKRRSSY